MLNMSTDIISGVEKEPGEVEFKGIDLATSWLESEEEVTDFYVEAYEVVPVTAKQYPLDDIAYMDITTYDENNNEVDPTTRWDISDDWNQINMVVERPTQQSEVTSELILGEHLGYDDPHEWVQRIERGKFRIGVQNGEPGQSYHVMVRFTTDADRVEQIHFPVDVKEVREVS